MEIDALTANVSLEYFWGTEITPKIFQKYIKAYNKRLEDDLLSRDISNHQLGRYIMSALAEVLGGKRSYPERPQLVKHFEELSNQQQQQPIRWYSREETEAWLAEQKRLKEKREYD